MKKGYRKLAREIAFYHYNEVLEVYKNTGTFWEYYSPEKAEPGFMARKEFVGWSGLPPIAELIEFIIGIRGDYSKQQIVWDMNLTEANGIERYPFGPEGIISLKAEARRSVNDEPHITVDTNIGFELFVLYGEKEKKITVLPGKHMIKKIIYEKEYVTTSFPEDGGLALAAMPSCPSLSFAAFRESETKFVSLRPSIDKRRFVSRSCRGNH